MLVPEIEIIVTKEGAEVVRKTLKPGDYVIGREPECDVQVEVELVSRRHAQLTVNFDHALIEDLGSSNGTFINGKPVTECTRLWPNQKIQVGAATIELRRVKTAPSIDTSLAPSTATVQRLLPEELLRDRKYDIGGVIAQGGMGAILDAREAAIQRGVAMKVMLDGSSPGDLVRFIAEARVTGQLEHPNIVPIHELGVDENGQVFYTMKMVHGITLKKILELLAEGVAGTVQKYPLGQLLTVFQKVCDAVSFAHSKGVLHRDLKPENVMLGDFGEVLLMDWGLAKILGQREAAPEPTGREPLDGSASATMAGSIMGTPHYMSPEQARGEIEELDARTDIYALGAILYHLLALRASVEGDDAMAIVEKVARGEIEPLPAAGGRIPDSLAAVVRKAMALDKTQRYAAVADLQADLTAYQNGFATSAEKAGWFKRAGLAIKRNKAASIGLAAVLLVGATLGTKAILEGRRAAREAAAAKATLADLRRTAPVFYTQAKVDFEEGNFDAAIEKIGYAIQLDEANADYHLFRANLRESSQDLTAAAEGYRRVLALRPADAAAKSNLALCETLLRETGGAPLGKPQQITLLKALLNQKRPIEAAPLAELVNPDTKVAKAAILSRLREARKQPGWYDSRLYVRPDGTFGLGFTGLAPIDFSVLKGQPLFVLNAHDLADLSSLAGLPLKELDLTETKALDLSPLRGMLLQILKLDYARVSDLSPLAGMPLTVLSCYSCSQISDLSPLQGAPLIELDLKGTSVKNLTPLAGAPLKRLVLSNSWVNDITPLSQLPGLEELELDGRPVTDLAPLAKLHLTWLSCQGTKITSIAPLRGQPLRFLILAKTGVTDLSPLADCAALEEILLPDNGAELTPLRKLPQLRLISTRSLGGGFDRHPAQSAEEFWKEYDAQQAAGKK